MEIGPTRLIDSLPGLVWTALPDGSIEYVGQKWLDYTGLTLEDAVGAGWAAAIHPDDLSGLLARWTEIRASGAAGEAEARLRGQDGIYRRFLFRACPMREASGEVVRWCGMTFDIDDRVRAEAAVRRAEEKLAAEKRLLERVAKGGPLPRMLEAICRQVEELVPAAACGILLIDTDRGVFRIGAAPSLPAEYSTTLEGRAIDPGETPAALAVTTKTAVIVGDLLTDPRWRSSALPQRLLHYGLRSFWVLPVLSGANTVLGVFAAYHRQDQLPTPEEHELMERFAHVAGIAIERDQAVRESKRAEEALTTARAELAHAARVLSLGALSASITHEVSQPLAGILTNANSCLRMLSADPPRVEPALRTVQRTIRDANRASEVIQRLRSMFGRKPVNRGLVDLCAAAREVLALSSTDLQRRGVAVSSDFPDALPAVRGDRVQLQQVILNLVLNGADAMGGIDDRPRHLLIRIVRETPETIQLSVRDSGVGFAPGSAEQLFQPFYTTKAEGMGIGLSISRSIIEGHGGRLWAAANDGPGATFSFSVPCGSTSAAERPHSPAAAESSDQVPQSG